MFTTMAAHILPFFKCFTNKLLVVFLPLLGSFPPVVLSRLIDCLSLCWQLETGAECC